MKINNSENLFKKIHTQIYTNDKEIIENNNNFYNEKNPNMYDLIYEVEHLKNFEYIELLYTLKKYIEIRNFYIPNTIIIRRSKVVKDGVYVYSYTNNILYRIKKIDINLSNYLTSNKDMYITMYADIKNLVQNYKNSAYFKGVFEVGFLVSLLLNNDKFNFFEYNFNIYYFPKLQGIDITQFAQYYVIGVDLKYV